MASEADVSTTMFWCLSKCLSQCFCDAVRGMWTQRVYVVGFNRWRRFVGRVSSSGEKAALRISRDTRQATAAPAPVSSRFHVEHAVN